MPLMLCLKISNYARQLKGLKQIKPHPLLKAPIAKLRQPSFCTFILQRKSTKEKMGILQCFVSGISLKLLSL